MLPRMISVLGKKYKITKKYPREKGKEDVNKDLQREFMGLFIADKDLIWINPKQSEEDQWRTLFHELGHATMYRNGVRFSGEVPEGLEEIIVETFSSVFFECFDNLYPGFYREEDDD